MSGWERFIGIVAETIVDKNNPYREIVIPEITPIQSGELSQVITQVAVNNTNRANGQYQKTITATNTVKCKFLGSAHGEVPDVYIGEEVHVARYRGSDVFYWYPWDDQPLRQREHVKIRAANRGNIHEPLDESNTYCVEIDTLFHKHIFIKTSMSDGESFGYLIKIDAETHQLHLTDYTSEDVALTEQARNSILIDSTEKQVCLTNVSGTQVDLRGENLNVRVPGDLTANVGGLAQITAPHIELIGAVAIIGPCMITEGLQVTGGTLTDTLNAESHSHG